METVLNKKVAFPQVLRLMGISRSPIFALFSRTLRIRDTLRAFAAQRGFEEEATELVERNSALYLTRMLIGFWTQNSLNLVAVGLGTKNRFRWSAFHDSCFKKDLFNYRSFF